MNHKDCNAIVKIMNKRLLTCECDDSRDTSNQLGKHKQMIEQLADYMEKEDLEGIARIKYAEDRSNVLPEFNRKQFLKDCGVE